MRILLAIAALALTACSSSTPQRAETARPEEKHAAAQTDKCLDNPELAKAWGDCNVKSTVFQASADLEKCRAKAKNVKGSVDFELRIRANGSVKHARVVNGRHGKLTNCVAKVFKKLQFAAPPQGKEATITVPFQLEP